MIFLKRYDRLMKNIDYLCALPFQYSHIRQILLTREKKHGHRYICDLIFTINTYPAILRKKRDKSLINAINRFISQLLKLAITRHHVRDMPRVEVQRYYECNFSLHKTLLTIIPYTKRNGTSLFNYFYNRNMHNDYHHRN